jgi:hypothetical protein
MECFLSNQGQQQAGAAVAAIRMNITVAAAIFADIDNFVI